MPIDPSIPLQAKGVQLESPVNQLTMMNEALKYGEMNRSIDTQNKLRELYSQGIDVGTPEGFKQVAAIDPATALKLRTDALKSRELEGNIKKTSLEVDAAQRIGAVQRIVGAPDAATAASILKSGMADGSVPIPHGNEMLKQLSTMKYPDWQMSTIRSVVKPETIYQGDITKRGQDISAGTAQRGQDLTYAAATQPVFSEASGGFVTRPTATNPSSTVIPLANPEATTKGQVIAKGKNLVNDVATDMATSYGVLKDLGGIKSRENSPQKNMSAALQSSTVGQIGGSLMGTPEQDARDAIKSQRPILVQAIVKATGMSSQQINSNQELKNMLDAATDPGLGYETNIKTLNKINKRFGLGGNVAELPSTTSNTDKVNVGAPQKINPKIDALLKKYEEQ